MGILYARFDFEYHERLWREGEIWSVSPAEIVFRFPGTSYRAVLAGEFLFESNGNITGTIESYSVRFKENAPFIDFSNMNLDAETYLRLMISDSPDFVEYVFSGNDTLVQSVNWKSLFGYSGDDTIYGGAGADTLDGGAGDDVIYGGGSNDLVDGDVGNDTAAYLGVKGSYTLTIGQSSTIMTDRTGAEGTDTLINIEKLAFTDRTLDLTNYSSLTQLNGTQIKALAEMYVAYFNRAPDAEGLFYWADKLAEGRTMDQIAERFFDQDETRAIYTDPSNIDAFVTAVYANVLGRTPDANGFEFWTGKLAANEVTQGAFVLKIILGAKNGGGPEDIAYLSDKTDLSIYFSAIKGLTDAADGRQVMVTFGDQSTSDKTGAKAAIDGHYSDATASGGGEFIFELVGIVNDPFAGVI